MEPVLSFIDLCRAANYNRLWDRNAQQIRREICDPKSSFHRKYTTFCDTADWNRLAELSASDEKGHGGYGSVADDEDSYYHEFSKWPNYKEAFLWGRRRSASDPDKAKQIADMLYSVTSNLFHSKLSSFWKGAIWHKDDVNMQKLYWHSILKTHKLTPLCIISNKQLMAPSYTGLVFSYFDGTHTNVCYSPSGIDSEIAVKIAVAAFMQCLKDPAQEKFLIQRIINRAASSIDSQDPVKTLGHDFDHDPYRIIRILAALDKALQSRFISMIWDITQGAHHGFFHEDPDLLEIACFIGDAVWTHLPGSCQRVLDFKLTRHILNDNRSRKNDRFSRMPRSRIGENIFDDSDGPLPISFIDYEGEDPEYLSEENHQPEKRHYKVSQLDVLHAATTLVVLDIISEFQSLIADYLLSAPYLYFGAIPTYFPKASPCASVRAPLGFVLARFGMYYSRSLPCEFNMIDASRAAASSIDIVLKWALDNNDSPSLLRRFKELPPSECSKILCFIENFPEYPFLPGFSRDMPAIKSANTYTPARSLLEFHKIISSAPALAPVLFGLLYHGMYKLLAMRCPKTSASSIQSPFFVLPAEFATCVFPDSNFTDPDLPFTKYTLEGQERITGKVTANPFRYFSVRWYVFKGAPRRLNEKECLLLLRSAKTVILSNAVTPSSFTCLTISCALPADLSLPIAGALLQDLRTQIYAFLNAAWLSAAKGQNQPLDGEKAGSLSGLLNKVAGRIKDEKSIPSKWRAYIKPATALALLLDMMQNAPDGAQNIDPERTFTNLLLKGYADGFRHNSAPSAEHKRQAPPSVPVSLSTFRKYLYAIKVCHGNFEEFCSGGYIVWEHNDAFCLDYRKYWDDYLRTMGITAPRRSERAFRREVLAPYCIPGSNTEKNFRYDFRYTDSDSGKKYSFLRLRPAILTSPDTATE